MDQFFNSRGFKKHFTILFFQYGCSYVKIYYNYINVINIQFYVMKFL